MIRRTTAIPRSDVRRLPCRGCTRRQKVIDELDFRFGSLLDYLTAGRLSKSNYLLDTMKSAIDEVAATVIRREVAEARKWKVAK